MLEYSLRRESAGRGRFSGGNGVVRELEALRELTYSLITERRRHAPPGAAGGHAGAAGRNLLDGQELPPKATGRPPDGILHPTRAGGIGGIPCTWR